MSTFKLNVITPENTYYSGDVVSLILPGSDGYLGILAYHAPLVTPLGEGEITWILPDKSEKTLKLRGGFFEVSNNQATVLAEKITETTSA